MPPTRVVIAGAAGRDFHNFNVCFRDDPATHVVAFTATQIPDIDGRVYPPELAGAGYPQGIPIVAEDALADLVEREGVDEVVFSYSDVGHAHVMSVGSRALAAGADYRLIAPRRTMLRSSRPVVAVTAVRTGSGKSQTTRRVAELLREAGQRVAVVRHPMPYGDLTRQAVQRFAAYEDLAAHDCTIEEREEYEPHLAAGTVVFAGIDYERILRAAEREADVILWDGGNNDTPFFAPDVHVVVVDPHRAGHELRYHPGETNLRMASVVVVNKVDSAAAEDVERVCASVHQANPGAAIVRARSPITVEQPERVRGRRVLCVEDGPTLTHGEMSFGAAVLAAREHGAAELVDPRPFAVGSIAATYRAYPHVGPLLPAMGYGARQTAELAETIARSNAEVVLIGTPIDLRRLVEFPQPALRVSYRLDDEAGGGRSLADVLEEQGLVRRRVPAPA